MTCSEQHKVWNSWKQSDVTQLSKHMVKCRHCFDLWIHLQYAHFRVGLLSFHMVQARTADMTYDISSRCYYRNPTCVSAWPHLTQSWLRQRMSVFVSVHVSVCVLAGLSGLSYKQHSLLFLMCPLIMSILGWGVLLLGFYCFISLSSNSSRTATDNSFLRWDSNHYQRFSVIPSGIRKTCVFFLSWLPGWN